MQCPTVGEAEKIAKIIQNLTGAASAAPLDIGAEPNGIWMLPGFGDPVEIVSPYTSLESPLDLDQIVKHRWQQCVDLYRDSEVVLEPFPVVEVRAIRRALGLLKNDDDKRFMNRYFGRMIETIKGKRFDGQTDLISNVMRTLVRFPRRGTDGCESAVRR